MQFHTDTINRLFGTRCYLCGAMDRAADEGIGWRKAIRDKLNLGIVWLDPTCKPTNIGAENSETRAERRRQKNLGNWEYVAQEMKVIRCVDLRMVDLCDFMVVYLNMDVHACGTYEEIALANRQKKPIFICCEQGKTKAPDWLFGVIPHDYIHSTWPEVYGHIQQVAHAEDFVDLHRRWYFFDWTGVASDPNSDHRLRYFEMPKDR